MSFPYKQCISDKYEDMDYADIGGFMYINTGDFVESCSAIVEHTDGTMELIHWKMSEPTNAFSATSENSA